MWKWLKSLFSRKKEIIIDKPVSKPKPEAYQVAEDELGVKEIRGNEHNSRILEYHRETSLNASTDEVPWCAAFVNWCLMKSGEVGTRKANARSFLKWGRRVKKPKEGDIVVFWRGKKNGWQGHVGFFVKREGKYIVCLGGNQGDSVTYKKYHKSKVLDFRTYWQ